MAQVDKRFPEEAPLPGSAFTSASLPVRPNGNDMTTDHYPDLTQNLGLALLACSNAPALLLNGEMGVIGASESFYLAFPLKPQNVAGHSLFELGAGEWDVPQLRSLMNATLGGYARIEAYEMDFGSGTPRRLVLNARKLDYGSADQTLENGGAIFDHGSGGIVLLRAA
ncbi:hypothetical protein OSJ57_14910 [Sphingomonas sp. HH69]